MSEWQVPISDPRRLEGVLLELRTSNRGIGVTGHREADVRLVLDPRNGLPASSDILAAVALADSAADANALASALFVMGSHAAGDVLGKMIRAEAILLAAGNGEPYLLASVSLKGRLTLSPELEAEVGGRVRYLLPPETISIELPDR